MNYKFRGKTADGKWAYGFYVQRTDKKEEYICVFEPNYPSFIKVRPETVGQWTGLLDKNGDEIYEGDIIKHRTAISLVVNDFFYDACDFLYKGFFLEKIKSAYGYCLEFEKTNPEYEIIGNKIDNPELLEGK